MTSDESEARPGFTVKEAPDPKRADSLPPIDFATFVLSLATSAMVHLGQTPNPEGGEAPPPNLPLAQQTIDALEMLSTKTRGNLDEEEEKLLQSVLYELRMVFVEVKGKS